MVEGARRSVSSLLSIGVRQRPVQAAEAYEEAGSCLICRWIWMRFESLVRA